MADVTKPARRPRRRAQEEASKRAPEIDTDDVEHDDEREQPRDDDGGAARHDATLMSELRGAVRDAAIEVLKPVARQATTSAAKYAVKKGPDLLKDKVAPKITEAGGAGALAKGALPKVGDVAGGVAEKLPGVGGKGKKPEGTGRGRRLPVQEFVDVAADIETVYDQFTQFEDFPRFMHRVEKIEQRDDTTLMWHENIWGVRRSWEAEILEQIPCERLVWRGKGQTETVGVVTFHRLSDHLTRVYMTMDFQPKGLFEKTASGTRISRRALRSDMMRFKAFVEMRDEATGAWRGTIEAGEVSDETEGREDGQPEGREEEEPEGREDEEPEGREEEEPEGREDEEPEGREEDEYEDEEADEEPEASEDEDDEEDVEEEEEDEEAEERPAQRPRGRRRGSAPAAAKSGGRRR